MQLESPTYIPSPTLLFSLGSEMQFARARLTPESLSDVAAIESCRTNLTKRLEHCAIECNTCAAECTSAAARAATSAYRCSVGLPTVGLTAAFQSSDIGEDVKSRYGAIRTEQRAPAPDLSWHEQFHTMVNNRIDGPVAPRNSVSCRKSHHESTTGGYTPPLKKNGEYIERSGFMVRTPRANSRAQTLAYQAYAYRLAATTISNATAAAASTQSAVSRTCAPST